MAENAGVPKKRKEKSEKDEGIIAFREMMKIMSQNPCLTKGTCDIIVLNFRKFGISPEGFMKMIEKRFNKCLKSRDKSKTETSIRGLSLILCSWISNCIKTDFLIPGENSTRDLYAYLLEIIEKIKLQVPIEANKIKLALIRYNPKTLKRDSTRRRSSNKSRSNYKGKLLEFPAPVIAEQMTLFEYNIYSRITPSELIGNAWNKKDRMTNSPKVALMVERFNSVSYWVANQICNCRDFKDRINLLSTFIALANDLASLNNYNGLMEILGGLNNSSVQRLKRTWTAVSEKYGETWDNLNVLMDSKNNYSNYREHLQTAHLPAVPFLGVFLRDLTFIEDGNPDYIQKKINIEKYELMGSVFSEIQKYQSTSYSFVANRELQHYFTEVMIPVPEDADDILYENSIQAEPPSTLSSANIRLVDKEKIACKSVSI